MPTARDGVPGWRAQIARLEGAYSFRTIKNYTNAMKSLEAFCHASGRRAYPASPATVAAFVDEMAATMKPATVRVALCGIAKAHRLGRHCDPVADEEVRLAMRRAFRRHGRRQRQALPLSREVRDALAAACPQTLQGRRDRALILTAYDSLCRRAELVAIEVAHLEPAPEGGFHVFVPRAKNDAFGDGRTAHLSIRTRAAIEIWLSASGTREGPIFRGLRNGVVKETALDPAEISAIFKRVAAAAELPPSQIAGLSGHSARVGAACDFAKARTDALTIMRAGGWKSLATLARYIERVVVEREEGA
ncbi:tyrosine-type recombinase/integrase [Salinarimonas ramus]|uniref:Integrase n=1 Tax=Salinarimonas ramus TaxID=690164 RepID=A0A917QEV0_9HYPH|nr:tyrosine-type recombinase/integrase [Salinarimonas ramus]GGK47454.1 integrase [Salinarimonas ramus]